MTHPIPKNALTQHLAIIGKTGSGKSWTARGVVERLLDEDGRVCIIDPTSAWWGLKSSITGKRAGYPVIIFGGLHADLPLAGAHGEALAEIIGTSSTPVIIDTSLLKIGERTRFFTDFADALLRKNRGPLHLVIDEAHLFAPQGKVSDPQSGAMLHAANNLVSLGRSRGLRIMLITQRPAKLHKDSLTQVETLIAMRLIAPQDRKAVEDWIKDNADPQKGREIMRSLATLKTGQGWIWTPEVDLLARVSFPKIKTFDSSKAPDGSESTVQVLAPIDKEAIAARLKTVAADALANDPVTLKQRIAELERQGRAPVSTKQDLERAERRGYERALAEFKGKASTVMGKACGALLAAAQELNTLATTLKRDSGETLQETAPAAPIPSQRSKSTHRSAHERQPLAVYKEDLPKPPRVGIAGNGGIHLSAPQQKLLDKLAWLESLDLYPAPKETLAAVSGASPTSGGYFNNLGKLRSGGWIEYPQSGLVAFTTAGRAAAAAPATSGRPIHEHWLQIVSAPQRAILEALIEHHPERITKEKLAADIHVSPTSGGYFNNLGRLRTLGAIDYPVPGQVQLTRYVMP